MVVELEYLILIISSGEKRKAKALSLKIGQNLSHQIQKEKIKKIEL